MSRATRFRNATLGAAVSATLALSPGGAPAAQDLWVLTESQKIYSIDTRTLAVGAVPISLSGLTSADPTCLAFSSVAGVPLSAFVTQGSFVRVVDVASGAVQPNSVDVAALLGFNQIELTACSASAPRTFKGGAAVTRSHLFVGGNLPGGTAYWAVLDQRALIAGAGAPLIDSGRLHASARVLDAEVLDAPQGDSFQRAWFTLVETGGGSDTILNIPLTLPQDPGLPPRLGATQSLTLLTSGLPLAGVGIGATREGRVPVQPGFNTGRLTHLETGASCSVPGNPTRLSVHGPAPNSYSVFALDPLNSDVLAINPGDCSSRAFDVGLGPVALVPRRGHLWDGLFVLNHGGDSVSFLDPRGELTTLPLPTGAGPVAGGIAQSLPCQVDNLLLDKNGDDIELSWEAVGCGGSVDFSAWCNCIDDALDCPCVCDCSVPSPGPDCACPFAQAALGARGPGGVGGFLLDYNPGDQPTTNPWKKLESTPGTSICHEGVLMEGSWFYLINQSDEPPSP